MRICIYGAGAMGTSLGALFLRSAVDCDLVSRNRAHVSALKESGFSALLPEEMAGRYDLIFLATKQRDNARIAGFLEDRLTKDGALVTVQNGLPEPVLAAVLGADRVYGCTLSWGAELIRPGEVRETSDSGHYFALGAYGGGARLNEIAQLLQKIGDVTTGDLNELRYAKLAVNASFSTLSAISGLTFGAIAGGYKRQALSLIRETFSVARAKGCAKLPLNGHDLFRVFGKPFGGLLLPFAMKRYENTRSGMLKDLEAGRRCDVDFVAGAVVKAGAEAGVETPKLARAVALVHEIENGLAEIAPESIELLEEA